MNIDITQIKNELSASYQFVARQAGKLKNYTVCILNQTLKAIQHNPRLAIATLSISNLLFLKVAIRLMDVVDRFMDGLLGSEKEWSEEMILTKSFFSLTALIGLIGGMNIALWRGLQLPLSPRLTAAIGVATCTSYIAICWWTQQQAKD